MIAPLAVFWGVRAGEKTLRHSLVPSLALRAGDKPLRYTLGCSAGACPLPGGGVASLQNVLVGVWML